MRADSIYVHAHPFLQEIIPNFDELGEKEKDNLLEKVALFYQDKITESYDKLAKEAFNVTSHRLEMKTEAVIRSAYFRATRRYAQWITKKEGIEKEELDIKGLEYKKSNFPPVLGKFFQKILIKALKGAKEEDINQEVSDFKAKVLNSKDEIESLTIEELGNPTSVKKLTNYQTNKRDEGTIFSHIKKGAPASVKASIIYNDLIDYFGYKNKFNYISQGSKVKWVYLKSNPYHIEAIAFINYEKPPKIWELMEQYIDRGKTFEAILVKKLTGFFNDLGWSLQLNPFIDKFFKF